MLYKDAGVNINEADKALAGLKAKIKKTHNKLVLKEIGYFGAAYKIPEGYKEPVLISSIDSVGTKVLVALKAGKYDGLGEDIVNHCVNDILTMGAKPLYILDYFASGKLKKEIITEIIEGMIKACEENECALIGGETAEMPDIYSGDIFDFAAEITGIVENSKIIDGKKIKEGQKVYGLKSSGFHTNGYSLIRNVVFDKLKLSVDSYIPELQGTLGEVLLKPHRSYYKEIYPYIDITSALIHITGGGFYNNIPRIIPEGLTCYVNAKNWEIPVEFSFISENGKIPPEEMFTVFNMGIGMIVIADKFDNGIEIGEIRKGKDSLILDNVENTNI
jgi:phosphoribosylformylglycinamidine cyclo-ligase